MPKIKKWKILGRKKIFEYYGRGVEKVRYEMPDGNKADFYIANAKQPVCVLALTKDKKVILAKQFRPGPNKILLEIPGGQVKRGESPSRAAGRELLEETGYTGKLKFIGRCYDCAYSNIHRYCFVATDCEKISPQKLEKYEYAEVVLLPLAEFRKLLRKGQLTDVEVGYLGLDYLKLL